MYSFTVRTLKLAKSLSQSHTSEGCEVLATTWVTTGGREAPCSGHLGLLGSMTDCLSQDAHSTLAQVCSFLTWLHVTEARHIVLTRRNHERILNSHCMSDLESFSEQQPQKLAAKYSS